MNINYPYLAGYLQSELKNLAGDAKFLKLKSFDARMDYVQNILNEATIKAKQFESNEVAKAEDALEDFNYVGSRHHY